MNLKDILAISGKPGLYKISANRDNGLIASELGSEKKAFFASRQHMFTPLENITIYTETDHIELSEIFKKMKEDKNSLSSLKNNNDEYRKYFTKIVPDHDQEKVYTSDIKKIIKWYKQLDQFGYLKEDKKASKEKASKAETSTKAKKSTKKPATKTSKPKMSKPKAPVKKVEKRGSQRGK